VTHQRLHPELESAGNCRVVPASRAVLEALARFRSAYPGVGEVLIFSHPKQKKHRGKPVNRHLAAYWLKRAYELSGLPKPEGSLWHAFRRMRATERKNVPVKDVAAAGGWNDIMTLMECYQQPEEETLRSVVEYKKPRPASAGPAEIRT
jgi:hypothetical protein